MNGMSLSLQNGNVPFTQKNLALLNHFIFDNWMGVKWYLFV